MLELSVGDLADPLIGGTGNSDPAAAMHPSAPTVEVPPGAFVVSVADVAGDSVTIDAGNPFVALPVLAGNDAAYYVAPATGSYAAAWLAQGVAPWCASTAAFRPAP